MDASLNVELHRFLLLFLTSYAITTFPVPLTHVLVTLPLVASSRVRPSSFLLFSSRVLVLPRTSLLFFFLISFLFHVRWHFPVAQYSWRVPLTSPYCLDSSGYFFPLTTVRIDPRCLRTYISFSSVPSFLFQLCTYHMISLCSDFFFIPVLSSAVFHSASP